MRQDTFFFLDTLATLSLVSDIPALSGGFGLPAGESDYFATNRHVKLMIELCLCSWVCFSRGRGCSSREGGAYHTNVAIVSVPCSLGFSL
jgi:hypothetical protein